MGRSGMICFQCCEVDEKVWDEEIHWQVGDRGGGCRVGVVGCLGFHYLQVAASGRFSNRSNIF